MIFVILNIFNNNVISVILYSMYVEKLINPVEISVIDNLCTLMCKLSNIGISQIKTKLTYIKVHTML